MISEMSLALFVKQNLTVLIYWAKLVPSVFFFLVQVLK